MPSQRISRRTMLRAGSGLAIGLPLLDIMGSRTRAQTVVPKRFVSLFTANGFLPHLWAQPAAGGFELGPILESLAEHKDDLIVVRGLRQNRSGPGSAHQVGAAKCFTGAATLGSLYANGPSVDQRIAAAIGTDTRFSSLELSVQAGSGPNARMVYTGAGAAVAPTNSPAEAFDRVFGGITPDPRPAMEDIRSRRASVLDLVRGQFGDIERIASREDRIRLDQHQESIRSIERNLLADPEVAMSCGVPTRTTIDFNAAANVPAVSDAHIDIMAYAFACDLTRVATLQWGDNSGGYNHPFVPEASGLRGGYWHTVAHDASEEVLASLDKFYVSKVARLISALKSFGAGDSNLFANTTMLWGAEIARGNHGAGSDGRSDRAYLVAGSAGGALSTGRYLDLERHDANYDNNLLLSMLRAFDIDDGTFGEPSACAGGAIDLG